MMRIGVVAVVHSVFSDLPQESYQTVARYRKAVALAGVLRDFGTPAELVPGLSAARRRQVEAAADVRLASDVTWGVVALLLRDKQSHVSVADVHQAIARYTDRSRSGS